MFFQIISLSDIIMTRAKFSLSKTLKYLHIQNLSIFPLIETFKTRVLSYKKENKFPYSLFIRITFTANYFFYLRHNNVSLYARKEYRPCQSRL